MAQSAHNHDVIVAALIEVHTSGKPLPTTAVDIYALVDDWMTYPQCVAALKRLEHEGVVKLDARDDGVRH